MHPAKNVLLPVTGETWDEEAFQLACTLAKGAKGKINAIYVIEVARDFPVDAEIGEETRRGEEVLGQIESLAREAKCPLEAYIIQARQAGPAIIQEAISKETDVIILGVNYRRNSNGFQIGDTASYVLQNAQCPVLLWRNRMSAHLPVRG